jgi:hypothetical protein
MALTYVVKSSYALFKGKYLTSLLLRFQMTLARHQPAQFWSSGKGPGIPEPALACLPRFGHPTVRPYNCLLYLGPIVTELVV